MARTKCFEEREVLLKAVEIFWRKGFHATSIQNLVDGLGINRASLYDTFGGKEALFQKALALYQNNNRKAFTDFLSTQPSVKEGISQIFKNAIEMADTDPEKKGCFVVNITTELGATDPEIAQLVSLNRSTFEQIFLEYLQQVAEKGEIPKDKDLKALSILLFTIYNGLQVVVKTNPKKADLHLAVKAAIRLLD